MRQNILSDLPRILWCHLYCGRRENGWRRCDLSQCWIFTQFHFRCDETTSFFSLFFPQNLSKLNIIAWLLWQQTTSQERTPISLPKYWTWALKIYHNHQTISCSMLCFSVIFLKMLQIFKLNLRISAFEDLFLFCPHCAVYSSASGEFTEEKQVEKKKEKGNK